MGASDVKRETDQERQRFVQQVLNDVRALERMLQEGLVESGVHRIGAEQEMFLVGSDQRPTRKALQVLEEIDDPHFTTELAQFNLELNLDPLPLSKSCLSVMENQLDGLLEKARRAAEKVGAQLVLTGILPTLEMDDLGEGSMTPIPRYKALDTAVRELRGSDFQFMIKGRDELMLTHDTVMLESCNTSFQIHFQTDPDRFVDLYNIAQALAGPTLAAAVHSPLLFGHRLWKETRIALFKQSVDTRGAESHHRRTSPRVTFGDRWIEDSVLDIFREDLTRFRLLLGRELEENPLTVLDRGEIPRLGAMCLHNGTVYRWNRPCYGVFEGKPHLRIENRILPAGPSVVDEVANSAFWFGLIKGFAEEFGDITQHLRFDDVKENFLAAARLGLNAQFQWRKGKTISANDLVCKELMPLAYEGLKSLGVGSEDRDRYLGVLQERVESGRTGSQWLLDSLAEMKSKGSRSEQAAALTAATVARQKTGKPVHEWDLATLEEATDRREHYRRVGSLMTTDLFTVNEDEVIDLVAAMMDWKKIRHVPVEDHQHRLVGLVTGRKLIRLLTDFQDRTSEPVPVREVMRRELITVTPQTTTLEAMNLMRDHKISCLPVVENQRLVGIITEHDFMNIFHELLESYLGGDAPQA